MQNLSAQKSDYNMDPGRVILVFNTYGQMLLIKAHADVSSKLWCEPSSKFIRCVCKSLWSVITLLTLFLGRQFSS